MAVMRVKSQSELNAITVDRLVIADAVNGGWIVLTEDDIPPRDVPLKVTRRQFRQGLTRLGLRAAVEAWRTGLDTSAQAGQDAADWYDDSNEFERQNPIINTMAAQFGLTAAQVDAAFVMMAGL